MKLDGDDGVDLFVDRERLLPVTDPFDRQIVVGCGAFVELTVLAARARGRDVRVEAFPEGAGDGRLDDRPVARLAFTGGGAPDPLFDWIGARRSNKEAYDPALKLEHTHIDALVRAGSSAGGARRGRGGQPPPPPA